MRFALHIRRPVLALSLLVALTGCVAGQTIKLDYAPAGAPKIKASEPVMVSVTDNRPFVLNKSKSPSYLGHYRAGFGNTWDVNTSSGEALATVVQRDLSADLEALGFTVAASAPRKVQVTINDWNFDAYINGRVKYDIGVAVLDGANRVLAKHEVTENTVIEGSFWVGPKYAFEREFPKIYRIAIRRLVREDTGTLQALQK